MSNLNVILALNISIDSEDIPAFNFGRPDSATDSEQTETVTELHNDSHRCDDSQMTEQNDSQMSGHQDRQMTEHQDRQMTEHQDSQMKDRYYRKSADSWIMRAFSLERHDRSDVRSSVCTTSSGASAGTEVQR